ncbi:NADP-dependent 3-hydroxy acid dehydrogenase YdfG [Nocardioides zeae]|uniref:NADP-dependent 3-hydroxy acid dehydrogenase YdfG n=1 Tax=Nocardioides zeae TaxID=1457234 RepID=A0ACC6IE50_9ACTN|nr:SDR family NAD(P)-dependent oxidoreductase [Nocardioides zeae]MDR6174199.1 NADP-dependent 3-hydroxy acid dehydrogenase YdfG [Nocardioides zeae]MDR6209006.1 NADP-dependent 3-hydroxy acid dehydrogenase YdfG [Nocardioides zeae]
MKRNHPADARAVVVTGAASGIGRALARHLAERGCPIALADKDEAGLAETAHALPTPTLVEVVDVRDAGQMHDFASKVRAWAPRDLWACFNNAGVAVNNTVASGDPADDQWLHDINFHGVVNGTRAFLPHLLEQGSGAVVNTSSVYGLLGVPLHSAYCASKFAVRGFTEALHQELIGTGVRAVTVHPGGVKTSIAHNARVSPDALTDGETSQERARAFDAAAITTPERAARTIVRAVERGRSRVLVGPDAVLIDALARVTPTHAAGLVGRLEKRLSGSTTSAVGA